VRRSLNPATWMIWAISAGGVALLTRDPWYLLLIGATGLAVRWRATGERPSATTLRLFVGLMVFSTLFNFLFSRAGDTILLKVPVRWVGGPYTLEALLFGAVAGLQLASLLQVMMTFSALLSPTDLLRRLPAGLAQAGIIASIAMNFAPQARRSFDAVREAQQVRGHSPRGLRDLGGIVTPLVILSLESAMAVGEGLATRGWGAEGLRGRRRLAAWGGACLLAVGVLVWWLIPAGVWLAALIVLGGGVLLLLALTRGGARSRYRPEAWEDSDTLITGVSLGVLVVMIVFTAWRPLLLTYEPYPRAAWPMLDWPICLALGLLMLPALLPRRD
jgi:energy-coupling factor transport system permease protein